jgi:hypothetical protein
LKGGPSEFPVIETPALQYDHRPLDSGTAAGEQSACTAITDTTVVATDVERLLAHTTVLVNGDRIAAVGPAATVRISKVCRLVDGRGRFLIPGLVDSHVHLYGPGVRPDDRAVQEQILSLLLPNGVTTAINMLGSPEILKLRADLAEGKVLGPKLYTTGIFFESEHAYSLGPFIHLPTFQTAEEVRSEVLAEKIPATTFSRCTVISCPMLTKPCSTLRENKGCGWSVTFRAIWA